MRSNMQWCQSIPTFHVRIGASLEQQSSGSQVPVLGRHVQSSEAFLQCRQNHSRIVGCLDLLLVLKIPNALKRTYLLV